MGETWREPRPNASLDAPGGVAARSIGEREGGNPGHGPLEFLILKRIKHWQFWKILRVARDYG
jgi:hypothetical protein